MTEALSDAALRHWLIDYLVTNLGCDPNGIDVDASLSDLGVGSRDAVVLSGELAELLGRSVSPVDFWQHPTINALVQYFTTPESETRVDTADAAGRVWDDEPIAVVGLGCRFPGNVYGPQAFWQFLREGRSAVGEVPPDRWAPFDNGSPEVAAALSGTTRWGSFLADIDGFDAEFFEISPREAAKMDPQQRLLLEVAYEALEHAGIPADSLRRTQTGVFVGACASEYGFLTSTDLSQVDAWSGTGGALSIIANRVSYYFDLRGPSVTVDTACSSSLVGVHMACQSLRTGESDLAIAAGVNLLLSPAITRSFDQAQAMSPTGQCHPFDASADGFVRGEGCGVAVLKRLSDAVRDGDPVLAVVRGSAVNQDGRSNGLMAPNPAAQMAVLRAAYTSAGVEPRHVDYVEAHGIGTLLGDPIEARALGSVLGRARSHGAPLLIGAVKSNLGNLEAAGIAGFIKAVLSVKHGHIPANHNFHTPNPHIPFDDLRLKVVAEPTDWPVTGQPRRAGVSSFGFGGTNAHVVLEQGPEPVPTTATKPRSDETVTTLVVSGKTAERVAATAETLAEWMNGAGADVGLAEVAHTLNHHRTRHAKFGTVAALDRDQAVAGLRALGTGQSVSGVVGPHEGPCRPGTVFVYSGDGSQWAGMGRQLLADEPAFAAAVAELEPIFVEQVGFSLQHVLSAAEPLIGIDRNQPVLVGMQLALTELWRSYGVEPDALIGHSIGQVATAVVAGALSRSDGLRVIATYSQLMSRSSGEGATALLELDAELRTALADLSPKLPTIPVITATGAAPVFDADYWVTNLVDPVRFSQTVTDASADHGTFIEVSPHPLLTAAISDTLTEVHHHSIGTLARDTHDTLIFHTNLNTAHTNQPPNIGHPAEPHPAIPTTPWHHTRHWIDLPETPVRSTRAGAGVPDDRFWLTIKERLEAAVSAPRSDTLLGEHVAVATTPPIHLWQARLEPEASPASGLHRIPGMDEVSTSVLLHTLWTAATECGASALSDVRFEQPILLDQPRVVRVVADGESVMVSSGCAADTSAESWTTNVSAHISHSRQEEPDGAVTGGDQAELGYDTVPTESVAALQRASGIEGQLFGWSIDSCQSSPGGLHAQVNVPEGSTVALLDAAIQVAQLVNGSDPRPMLPAVAESVRFRAGFTGSHGAVKVYRRDADRDELVVDIVLTAPDGSSYGDIRSLRYAAMNSDVAQAASHDELTTVAWSEMSAEKILGELEARLRAILANELGMSASAIDVDRPFPELGLDSMMAMAVLKEARRLVGFDLSATMLWDHPTIASLAAYLVEMVAPPGVSDDGVAEGHGEVTTDSDSGVLDALFDSVESATAGSQSGIR